MEDIDWEEKEDEEVIDIDCKDTNNPLACPEYIGDVYTACKKMEVNKASGC